MIAQRKLTMNDLQNALERGADVRPDFGQDRNPASRQVHGLAPAQGLILAEVSYPLEALRISEDND